MKSTFILKLYCAAALIGAIIVVFTCESAGIIVYCLSAIGGAIMLATYKQDKAAYYNDNGEHYAILTKGEIKYKIAKDGNYMDVSGSWFPIGTCPDNSVGKRVFDLNSGKPKHIHAATIAGLSIAACIMVPALFPATLATPQWVSMVASFGTSISFFMAFLSLFIGIAATVWYLGGVTIRFSFSPVEVEFEAAQLPDNFDISPDILLIQEKGESNANYAKRIQAANAAKGENTLVIAAKGHPVWMAASDDGIIAINRMEGSEQFGIPANPDCMGENQADYKKSLGQFMRAWFVNAGTAQKRIAALSDSDPVAAMAKQMAQTFVFVFFSFVSFGQNNSAKALEYLGTNYETIKPSGAVAFNFKKLTVRVQGDGKKTFADLLTHSTNFDDAGPWGDLQVVTIDGMAVARVTPSQPVAVKEKPKGDLQPMPDNAGKDMMGGIKTYFSSTETDRRIYEREKAAEDFTKEYGDNIRRDFLSMCLIPLKYLFWFLAIIGGAFWVASYISAKESAIFSNGIPIFGSIQNWVHGWSSGVLYVIVMLYAVVYVLYSTLAWIVPIDSPIFAIPLFLANIALTANVAHRLIPNKRVRGGQPFSGQQAAGQRMLNS